MPPQAHHVGILSITNWWGGAERHTAAVARELVARGHRVTLLEITRAQYLDRSHLPELAGITVLDERHHPASLLTTGHWYRLFRRHNLDTVLLPKGHFHLGWPALDLGVIASRVRYVEVEHSTPPWPTTNRPRWRTRIRRRLHFRALSRCLVVCQAASRVLAEGYHYPSTSLLVVPNGVDSSRFLFAPEARAAARNCWGVTEDACVIGTIARLAPEKRLDRLIRAFAALHRARPEMPLRLILAGDGPEQANLRQQCADLGIGPLVHWLGETARPAEVYPGLDLFAMTSETEAMPYTLLEAMACERTPVVMDVGGVGEVVQDGVNGLLVREDEAEFVAALSRAMDLGPAGRARMGRQARETILHAHASTAQVRHAASAIVQERDEFPAA
jgi:glycosyltransferase involved in cell wall biosynthesis